MIMPSYKFLSPAKLTEIGPSSTLSSISSSASSLSKSIIMFLWYSLIVMMSTHIKLSESGTVMLRENDHNINNMLYDGNTNNINSDNNNNSNDNMMMMMTMMTMSTTLATPIKTKNGNVKIINNEYQETASAELLRFVNDNDRDIRSLSDKKITDQNDDDNHSISIESIETNVLDKVQDNHNNNSSKNNNNDNNYSNSHSEYSSESMENLSLPDQVRLLSKQLNVLMTRRREDYELLERNLLKSLSITHQQQQQQQQQHQHQHPQSQSKHNNNDNNNSQNNNINFISDDMDLHKELQQLRQEVQSLQSKHLGGNNERLTIEWLQQSVSELRKQLVELQQIASNALHDVTKRTQSWEDLATIRSDFQQLKLELAALKERQQQTELYVQELRDETEQQEDEFRYLMQNKQQQLTLTATQGKQDKNVNFPESTENIDASIENAENVENNENDESQLTSILLPDHRRRHCRYQRQQLHELQQAQRQLKRQFNELKYQRLGARVRSLEIEQHRLADASFNLSRQIASLDKLHVSMLELLEDVETVQSKVDKNIPELRHEISKLEFSNAQLQSEQNIVHEEGKNLARSVQALAVTISTLQEERDGIKQIQSSISELNTKTDRLQTDVDKMQRSMNYYKQHLDHSIKRNHNKTYHHHHNLHQMAHDNHNLNIENAETLVVKLESAEHQFEAIIDKLPRDCSEIMGEIVQENNHTDGLYLIAPNGEPHRPIMAHCTKDGWTTIQRRFDGSANFNRSWEDYARGFGSPAGEFWMGNEHMHQLTLNNCSSLRVLMQDIYDNTWLAEYKQFYISSRSDGYRLHITNYSGNASDALDYQQDMQFSAIDVDRDISQTHCAANYEGGWWFSHCQHANLNGRYNLGLTWFDAARNEWIAVKSSQMMIKPMPSEACDNFKAEMALIDGTALTTTSLYSTTSATITATSTSWSPNSDINSESSITAVASNKQNDSSKATSNEMSSWQV